MQVARETDHSPDAVGKYCQQFNKVKWCVENEMGKEEIRIVTGMKAHLIDEYLKIIGEHKAALPPYGVLAKWHNINSGASLFAAGWSWR